MTTLQSECWILTGYPEGMPDDSTFRLERRPVPAPGDGEVLLETLYISVDPYMRGRMSPVKSYVAPLQPGDVIAGPTVARVAESRTPRLRRRRARARPAGLADRRRAPGRRAAEGGAAGGARLPRPRRARHARPHRLFRPARRGVPQAGRDGARLRGGRRRGLPRGPDRPPDGVPRRGGGGQRRQGALAHRGARLRRGAELQGPRGPARGARPPLPGRGGRLLRQRGRGGERRGARPDQPQGPPGDLRPDRPVQRQEPAARPPPVRHAPRPPRPRRGVHHLRLQGALPRSAAAALDLGRGGQLHVRETVVEGFANVPKAFLGLFAGENTGKMVVRL